MPQLANRANTLEKLLEKGDFPDDRLDSSGKEPFEGFYQHGEGERVSPRTADASSQSLRDRQRRQKRVFPARNLFNRNNVKFNTGGMGKTAKIITVICLLAVVLTAVGVIAGVVSAKKRNVYHSPVCTGNFTGNMCTLGESFVSPLLPAAYPPVLLDATCICTSSLPGQCGQLANGLVQLIPIVNKLFSTALTPTSLSTAIWMAQGAPIGNNCAPQVLLVDVSPGLNPVTSPGRAQWAQSALLWNLVQSQDLPTAGKMRTFISNAPWNHLNETDGPISDPSAKFQISASGFVFDFAAQTVSQPAVSFASNGQPTSAQLAQVGSTAQNVLDRMYSYALGMEICIFFDSVF